MCLFFAFRFQEDQGIRQGRVPFVYCGQHGAGRVLSLHGNPCGDCGRRVPFRDAGVGHGAAGRGNHGHPYRAGAHLRHAGNDAHVDVRHCLGACHGGAVAGYHAARPAFAVGRGLRAASFHRAAVLLREGQGVPRSEGALPRICERPVHSLSLHGHLRHAGLGAGYTAGLLELLGLSLPDARFGRVLLRGSARLAGGAGAADGLQPLNLPNRVSACGGRLLAVGMLGPSSVMAGVLQVTGFLYLDLVLWGLGSYLLKTATSRLPGLPLAPARRSCWGARPGHRGGQRGPAGAGGFRADRRVLLHAGFFGADDGAAAHQQREHAHGLGVRASRRSR